MGLWNRAKNLYREAGLGAVLRQVLIALRIYENFHYYLYMEEMKPLGDESRYLPKIDANNLTNKISTSKAELEKLIADGFTFKGQDIDYLKYVLGKGAVGSFLFVGKELASLGWMAMNKEAKYAFDPKPYKVDFANNEMCSGGTWTHPKYRSLGLSSYRSYKMRPYYISRGIKINRFMIETHNAPSIRSHEKHNLDGDYGPYAKAHFIRILGFGSWRETPLNTADSSG